MSLESAVADLRHAIVHPPAKAWRELIDEQLTAVRDALRRETALPPDGWTAARWKRTDRERLTLINRVTKLRTRLAAGPENARSGEVDRLLVDVEHHLQRLHDLLYDSVEMEIGGSE